MKVSVRQRLINAVGLIFVFFLQILDNALRQREIHIQYFSILKNGLLFLVLLLFLWQIYLIWNKCHFLVFTEELCNVLKMCGVFLILSVCQMIKNHGFNMITIEGIFRIMLPAIVAFSALNVLTFHDIYKIMVLFLSLSYIAYLFSIGISKLTLENFLQISFIYSHSPFESTFFSPAAMSFCLFFGYFRKNKLPLIVSVLFTVMTFKRIMVLYSVFLLIFGWLFTTQKKFQKWMSWIVKIVFLAITMVYIQMNLHEDGGIIERWLGISLNQFTMGRTWLFGYIYRNFESIGFMSSTVSFRSMEMDLLQIYVEMGMLSVIASIHYIVNVAKTNWYNLLIVLFILLELLTSHWFDIVYFWMIAYITIGCVAHNDKEVGHKKVNRKIRFRWG